ncbi:MAG: PilN domain-containing protein [Pseudomonadales bacterium]|nr:PilN domain-containing protein [Pseudomonadales bacterium]
MARINLLPWREERRSELRRQFFVILAGVAIIGAGSVFLVDTRISAQISSQESRNRYITMEQEKLDVSISAIKELKKQREQLVERMNVIQDLQGNRSVIVHFFDELAQQTPDGVFLSWLQRNGKTFILKGEAEANNRVSNFMRNLNDSDWFTNPTLASVVAGEDEEASSLFELSVVGVSPTNRKQSSEGGGG